MLLYLFFNSELHLWTRQKWAKVKREFTAQIGLKLYHDTAWEGDDRDVIRATSVAQIFMSQDDPRL